MLIGMFPGEAAAKMDTRRLPVSHVGGRLGRQCFSVKSFMGSASVKMQIFGSRQ
jgi:hypothetical protein